jgi:phosphatidylinositol alpha 1,6-mannosyltransferase
MLLDTADRPELTALDRWAEDRVHLNAAGHRGLAYAAADVLGVPHAEALGALESAVHEPDDESRPTPVGDLEWLRRHAAPWLVRRARGRTAGDGLEAKRSVLSPVLVPTRRAVPVPDAR